MKNDANPERNIQRRIEVRIHLSSEERDLIEQASASDNQQRGTWMRERAIEAARIWTGKDGDADPPATAATDDAAPA